MGDFLKEWPQGLGQLSGQGMAQINDIKYVLPTFPARFRSASSFALGLLDNNTGRPALPHGIQPIPVSTTNDPNTDALLNGWEVATRLAPAMKRSSARSYRVYFLPLSTKASYANFSYRLWWHREPWKNTLPTGGGGITPRAAPAHDESGKAFVQDTRRNMRQGGVFAGTFRSAIAPLTFAALANGFLQVPDSVRARLDKLERVELCVFLAAELEAFQKAHHDILASQPDSSL
eukprot:g52659.t1